MMKPLKDWNNDFLFSISADIDKFIDHGHLTEVLKSFLAESVKFEADDQIIPSVIAISNSIRKEAVERLKSIPISKKKKKEEPKQESNVEKPDKQENKEQQVPETIEGDGKVVEGKETPIETTPTDKNEEPVNKDNPDVKEKPATRRKQKIIQDPITPEEEAIINQMMDGPGSTDDGKAEMEMAIAADNAVEAKFKSQHPLTEKESFKSDEESEKVAILTNEQKEDDLPVTLSYYCPQCGQFDVMLSEDGKSLQCLDCGRNIEAKYIHNEEGLICPNCDEPMIVDEDNIHAICPQCEFICEVLKFGPTTQEQAKDESGLLKASGLGEIDHEKEGDKQLQEINEKIHQHADKIFTFEELPLPLTNPEDPNITNETMEMRVRQLKINGFFWNGEVFLLDEGVINAPIEVLGYKQFRFEDFLRDLKDQKRQYRLNKTMGPNTSLPWK
jgi:hypothetical protein